MNKESKIDSRVISSEISSAKVDQLERLAKATDRPRSWHIEQALDAYLEVQSWQVAHIEKAIAEMDAGEAIPHGKIRDWLSTWGKKSKCARHKRN